jgi:hypothetical protein
MGGVITIRGEQTIGRAYESEDNYADVVVSVHTVAPYGASNKSIGKAVEKIENKKAAFYVELDQALAGFDWNQ